MCINNVENNCKTRFLNRKIKRSNIFVFGGFFRKPIYVPNLYVPLGFSYPIMTIRLPINAFSASKRIIFRTQQCTSSKLID